MPSEPATPPAPSAPPAPPARAGHTQTILVLASAGFLSGVAMRVCDGLLPRLAADFAVTPGRAGWFVIAFSLAYCLMQLVFGPLGDRFGKARMVTVAVIGCAVFAGASAAAPGFGTLMATRIGWGVAAAGVVPLILAWVGDAVPFEDRQPVLAKMLMGTISGMMAGQLAGGLFADSAAGWRGAFATMAVAYVAVAVLMVVRLQPHRPQPPSGEPAPRGLKSWALVVEARFSRVVLAASFAEGVFLLGPLAFMPAMLHQRFGLSLSAAAGMLVLYAVGGLVYAMLARWIIPRFGQVRMLEVGGVLMGLGFLGWLFSPVAWTAAPVALAIGFGTYLFHNTLQAHATQMAPTARGTAVALFAFMLFLGQSIGTLLAGFAFDHGGPVALLAAPAAMLTLTGVWVAMELRRHRPAGGA
ncbi:MFS transporter [Ramlibacter sp.]|uniref:MFS transporter n=1 Tax=Ramlibacter sp. TaxID=1917967 RepID=UPI003D0DD8A1